MNRLNRAAAAARRAAAWLLPAGRRDWVAAIWAEAHEVPPGLARLAWRAGGAWVIAREALMPRRLGRAALFAAAAGVAAWAAWPQPAVGHAAVSQFHVIATVLLLAGLPLLARRFFGPATPSRAGRSLRVFSCAAILALMPAFAIVEAFANLTRRSPRTSTSSASPRAGATSRAAAAAPGRSTGGPPWPGEIALLLMTIAYLGVILFLTSRRSQVTRSTLAIGTGTGLLFGVVMYAVAPLGLTTTPPIRGCRDRRPIRWWRWPGSCCSAGRPPPPRWPRGAAAVPAAPRCPAASGSARASPPGCWRTGPPRCSPPRSVPARSR